MQGIVIEVDGGFFGRIQKRLGRDIKVHFGECHWIKKRERLEI